LKGDSFWYVTPCRPFHRFFGRTYFLHLQVRKLRGLLLVGYFLGSPFDHEEGDSMFPSLEFYWTSRRYIPEESSLHHHRCENLNFINGEFEMSYI
jgi:hypothetical protein